MIGGCGSCDGQPPREGPAADCASTAASAANRLRRLMARLWREAGGSAATEWTIARAFSKPDLRFLLQQAGIALHHAAVKAEFVERVHRALGDGTLRAPDGAPAAGRADAPCDASSSGASAERRSRSRGAVPTTCRRPRRRGSSSGRGRAADTRSTREHGDLQPSAARRRHRSRSPSRNTQRSRSSRRAKRRRRSASSQRRGRPDAAAQGCATVLGRSTEECCWPSEAGAEHQAEAAVSGEGRRAGLDQEQQQAAAGVPAAQADASLPAAALDQQLWDELGGPRLSPRSGHRLRVAAAAAAVQLSQAAQERAAALRSLGTQASGFAGSERAAQLQHGPQGWAAVRRNPSWGATERTDADAGASSGISDCGSPVPASALPAPSASQRAHAALRMLADVAGEQAVAMLVQRAAESTEVPATDPSVPHGSGRASAGPPECSIAGQAPAGNSEPVERRGAPQWPGRAHTGERGAEPGRVLPQAAINRSQGVLHGRPHAWSSTRSTPDSAVAAARSYSRRPRRRYVSSSPSSSSASSSDESESEACARRARRKRSRHGRRRRSRDRRARRGHRRRRLSSRSLEHSSSSDSGSDSGSGSGSTGSDCSREAGRRRRLSSGGTRHGRARRSHRQRRREQRSCADDAELEAALLEVEAAEAAAEVRLSSSDDSGWTTSENEAPNLASSAAGASASQATTGDKHNGGGGKGRRGTSRLLGRVAPPPASVVAAWRAINPGPPRPGAVPRALAPVAAPGPRRPPPRLQRRETQPASLPGVTPAGVTAGSEPGGMQSLGPSRATIRRASPSVDGPTLGSSAAAAGPARPVSLSSASSRPRPAVLRQTDALQPVARTPPHATAPPRAVAAGAGARQQHAASPPGGRRQRPTIPGPPERASQASTVVASAQHTARRGWRPPGESIESCSLPQRARPAALSLSDPVSEVVPQRASWASSDDSIAEEDLLDPRNSTAGAAEMVASESPVFA